MDHRRHKIWRVRCLRSRGRIIIACCMCGGRRLGHNRRLMPRMKQRSIASRSSWHAACNLIAEVCFFVTKKLVDILLPVVFDSAVAIMLCSWFPWTHACRVGEASMPGPAGIHTKHLKCDHCITWLSSTSALRSHTKRFHAHLLPGLVDGSAGTSAEICTESASSGSDSEASSDDENQVRNRPSAGGPYHDKGASPTSWQLMTASVTSLRQQYDEFMRLP